MVALGHSLSKVDVRPEFERKFYCMHSHSRKFIALNFVYCCLFFFFLNQLSTERRGFSSDAVPTLGLEGVHLGGSESCNLTGVCP